MITYGSISALEVARDIQKSTLTQTLQGRGSQVMNIHLPYPAWLIKRAALGALAVKHSEAWSSSPYLLLGSLSGSPSLVFTSYPKFSKVILWLKDGSQKPSPRSRQKGNKKHNSATSPSLNPGGSYHSLRRGVKGLNISSTLSSPTAKLLSQKERATNV